MTIHICYGDSLDPTHECSCEIGHSHSGAAHRAAMRERSDADS